MTQLTPIINPGGSDGHVQFNDNGAFGGESDLFWDDVNKAFLLGGVNTATADIKLLATGEAAFNEQGNSVSFRVESNSNINMFKVDGGLNRVDIGETTQGSIAKFAGAGGEIVFNDEGADIDFRIEGENVSALFVTDAGLDAVQISPQGTRASSANATFDGIFVASVLQTITGSTNITNATGFNLIDFSPATLTSASALTVTNSATLFIRGAPVASGSATLTNAYALWVDAGTTRLDGAVIVIGDLDSPTIYDVSKQGLVLAMNFNSASIHSDGTVLDSSGKNNHGTNNGATHNATGGFDNLGSGAFQFDGVDDFINIDTAQTTLASTTQGTWTAWVKPVDATPLASETFIAFGDTDANEFIYITIFPSGILNAFARSAVELKFTLQTDSAVFSDNTWTHIALVQDGTSPILYVDGVAVAQTFLTEIDKTYWFNDSAGIDNGRIGDVNRNNDGEVLHFNGPIDDVRIYDRALSSDEMKRLYLQRSEIQNSCVSQKDVFVDSSGNVGIGTTSPQELLHVGVGTDASDITATDLLVTRAGPSNLSVRDSTNGVETFLFASSVGGIIGTVTNDPLNIQTNNASAIFIDASQNVGIGTTTPISPFEVEAGLTTVGAVLTLGTKETTVVANDVLGRINFYAPLETGADAISVAASIVAQAEGAFDATTNTTSLLFQTGASEVATTKMTITSAGNVGIGTAVPDTGLDIQGGGILRVGGSAGPSYPTTGVGFEIAYDSNGQAGSGVGGTGVTVFQSFDRDLTQWRDLWFRAKSIEFNPQGGTTVFTGSTTIRRGQPDLSIDWTTTNQLGRVLFKENNSSKATLQMIGSAFADAARQNNFEFFNATTSGNGGAISFLTNGVNERMRVTRTGLVGIGVAVPAAVLHVDQPSTTAAIPVLVLDQADISEEMIQFETTIGTGNAIEAIAAKTLTTTHFIKVTLPGGLTRYIPAGTIA